MEELNIIEINTTAAEKKEQTSDLVIPDTWLPPYNTECPCCFEIPTQGRIILDCRHLLCIKCFITHLKRDNKCPVCRKIFLHGAPPRGAPPRGAPPTINNPQTYNEAAPTVDNVQRSSVEYREHMQRMTNIMTAANIERMRYIQQHQSPSQPHRDNYTNILRGTSRHRRQNLRTAPPLNAPRYDTSTCNYKFISILMIIDIMVMAVWMVALNKTH